MADANYLIIEVLPKYSITFGNWYNKKVLGFMLKQITLENWKSFRHAELYIDLLTVLIGTNASGKSNVVDALDFLILCKVLQ